MRIRAGPSSMTSPPSGATIETSFIVYSLVEPLCKLTLIIVVDLLLSPHDGGTLEHERPGQPEATDAQCDRAGRRRADAYRSRGDHTRGRQGRAGVGGYGVPVLSRPGEPVAGGDGRADAGTDRGPQGGGGLP